MAPKLSGKSEIASRLYSKKIADKINRLPHLLKFKSAQIAEKQYNLGIWQADKMTII